MQQNGESPWKRLLTPEQESVRLRGLRIIARMVARRHLALQGGELPEEASKQRVPDVDPQLPPQEEGHHVP